MKFKESPLVKNHKILTGTKRDMRKKVVKSTTPTSDLKKPTTLKRQLGGNIFTTYNSIAPYEGPIFEQPVATVEIEELPVSRLEINRQNVMAKVEEKKEEPVVEEKVSTEPLPTSKEEIPVVENKESTPINIKSKDEFIKTMTPAFENALKAKGLDTKYAKYLVAQSALESNWGKSQSGKFNFGGIKGKGTIRKTREVINGKSIHVNDSFRDFKDINDYANYHVSLLNNKRYQAFSGGDFIDRVVKGGYATDPNYKRALSNVYNQIAKAQEGMKIPKLKGAGELRNRILRQFNREKAANRNEEQLIGFDWSRYKSNKPKPETTPTQSEQLENGGVIKYQNPSSGIQRIGKPVSVNNSKDGGYNQSTLNDRQELLKKWDPTGGFDAASWMASKFFGNMANGEENEYYKTYLGLPNKVQPMKQGAQTNWDYQEEERKREAKEQPSDFYGTTPRMDYNIQAIADTLNTGRIVRNYDIYKQKEPSLPDKEYIERIYNSGKQVMENPSKWVQVEDGRAIKQGYDKQLEESDPLGMLGKFGMRWEPNQKALYVHDTYDFPWKARAATGIPVRPREMKIRGRINFDPNRGSALLRDSLSGFNSKYPKPITDEE